MALVDTLLKHLIAADAPAFAAWLLATEVAAVEPLVSELVPDPIRADAAFRVTRPDGQRLLLHVEFQGRSSRPPLPWRMLDYMTDFAVRERLTIHSVVIYTEPGAGAQDTGQHQHPGADGEPVLVWRYQAIHLWRWSADDLLSLGQPGLLPLVGLARITEPSQTLPRVVAAIKTEPDHERQLQLLRTLMELLPSEEVMVMAQQVLTSEDIEEMKRFPYIWQQYQEALAEGARRQLRAVILDLLVERFNPPAADYRQWEQVLTTTSDVARLQAMFQQVLHARELADIADIVTPPPQ